MKIIFVVNELDFFIRTHLNLARNINQTHEVEVIADTSKSSTKDLDLVEKMGIKLHILDRKKNSKSIEVFEGDIISTPPMEIHALEIGEDGNQFIVFSSGLRGGKDYEDDTFRVESIIGSK